MNIEPSAPPVTSELSGTYPQYVPQTWWQRLLGEMTFLNRYATWFETLGQKMQNIPATNYDIAVVMSNQGNMRDAILRLKIALWLAPNYPQALYLLGCCYIAVGKKADAKAQLKKLVTLEPDNEHANFMLATLDPSAVAPERYPTTIPLAIAQDYFANNALEYEALQQDQGYKGHQFVDEALWDMLDRRRTNYQVLELGCGTGLVGVLLAEHAEELVGVDFSREMLDMAQAKRRPDGRRVYTETLLQDIRHFAIDANAPRFDGVVAAHVFNYIGEIGLIFDGMMRCLKEGGYFVFQVERFGVEGRFGLVPDRAQFGHSDGYIRGHLQRAGFQLLANDVVTVYPDRAMVQYVARKPE
jgi:predicted TPR repeat methyltransferase